MLRLLHALLKGKARVAVKLQLRLQSEQPRQVQRDIHLHNQGGFGASNMADITARKVMELPNGGRHPQLHRTGSGRIAKNIVDTIASRLMERMSGTRAGIGGI